MSTPAVVAVLRLLSEGRTADAASAAADAALARDATPLAAALAAHLASDRAAPVYDEPAAFAAFISGGGNVALYAAAIDALRALHQRLCPPSVIDIGCGDGRVTAAVLLPSTAAVTLVEPSVALGEHAVAACAAPGRRVELIGDGALDALHTAGGQRWELAQSTWALHAIAPAERQRVFEELAERVQTLLVVEFDVPAFEEGSTEHLAYLAERYEHGVAEYADQPAVVGGFLVPVLVGQLDPDRQRYTFEQPIASWREQLHRAGFMVTVQRLAPYWWADAWLLVAEAPSGGADR